MEKKPIQSITKKADKLPIYLGDSFIFKNQSNELLQALSEHEKERAAKFITDKLSLSYIVPHFFLRKYMSEKLFVPMSQLDFKQENGGKPYCTNTHIDFNISHSKNLFAIVIADTEELQVGVDIEIIKPVSDIKSIVASHMHLDEQKYIFEERSDQTQVLERFYKIWTRKEAVLKMLGVGIVVNLTDICVLKSSFEIELKLIEEFRQVDKPFEKVYLQTYTEQGFVLSVASNEEREFYVE